jgi:hypothetical protein
MATPLFPLVKIPGAHHQDERLMRALADYHPIHVDDSRFSEKLTWCLEHCQNKFRDINTSNGRTWYFENQQDATLFAMKWA